MRKVENLILNLLLLLLIMFFARGPFYAESTLFSRAILAILLLISGFYLLKSLLLKNKNNSFYRYWLLLFSLNVVGFAFTGSFSNPLHSSMFIAIFVAIIPFFPFYYFSKKGILKENHLIGFFLLLLPVIIIKYYYNEFQLLSERAFSVTDTTNNIGYFFSALIPFLFFFKRKKVLSYTLSLILSFFILSSAKRGAILVGFIGMLCFLYFQLRSVSKKELFTTLTLVLVTAIILVYYGYEYIQSNEYLLHRLEATSEGDSSGRDLIYKSIFYSWFNTQSLIKFIFGFGFAASTELSATGHFAHNDWLELLSNFGLIGVSVYALLIYSLYSFIRSPSLSFNKKVILITILLMWLITSIFSMVYSSVTTAIQSLLLAYLIGSEKVKSKYIL